MHCLKSLLRPTHTGDCHLGEEGGESDNEYVLRSMMWADNYWIFCHNREILIHAVNDIIEELLNLDMEPKPESLRWTCSYEEEDQLTLKVGGGGKDWDLPFRKVFEVLGYRFQRDGKGKRYCAKGWVTGGATLIFIARKAFL